MDNKTDLIIKDWYIQEYPNDELGVEIKDTITFEDLHKALQSGNDVYEFLGVHDSIVRERCFDKLAQLLGKDYEYIYYLWLDNGEDFDDFMKKYVVKESLNESTELDRQAFVSLVKLGDKPYNGYSILNDGNFVKRLYADSDDDAISQFRDWIGRGGTGLKESVKLTEGTSNFWSQEDLPLYAFLTVDEAADKVRYMVYSDPEYDEEDDDKYYELEDKYYTELENDGYAVIDLDDGELYNAIDEVNDLIAHLAGMAYDESYKLDRELENNEYSDEEYDRIREEANEWLDASDYLDDLKLGIKPGYYEGAQLYLDGWDKYFIEAVPEDYRQQIVDAYNKIGKDFGLMKLGVAYHASNGETGYNIIKEDVSYTRQQLIDAVKNAYGFTNKEALAWIKRASEESKKAIVDGFRQNARRNFYDESLKESTTLTERAWRYTLRNGAKLRNAIDLEDGEGIRTALLACYKELLDNEFIDEYDYDDWTEEIRDADWEDEYGDLDDDAIDFELDQLYDLCDNIDVFVALDDDDEDISWNFKESLKEATTPEQRARRRGKLTTPYDKTYTLTLKNKYNYTVIQYRVNEKDKTIEKGLFNWGDGKGSFFDNSKELQRHIDDLLAQGYKMIESKDESLNEDAKAPRALVKVGPALPRNWVIAKFGNRFALMSVREFDKAKEDPEKWFGETMIELFPSKKELIKAFKREPAYKSIFDGIEVNESLKEDWYVFEYESGANPYIAKSERERDRIIRKYQDRVEDLGNGKYIIHDREEDLFSVDESIVGKTVSNDGKDLGRKLRREFGKGELTGGGNFRFNYQPRRGARKSIQTEPVDDEQTKIRVASVVDEEDMNESLEGRDRKKFITLLTNELQKEPLAYSRDEANDIAIKRADALGKNPYDSIEALVKSEVSKTRSKKDESLNENAGDSCKHYTREELLAHSKEVFKALLPEDKILLGSRRPIETDRDFAYAGTIKCEGDDLIWRYFGRSAEDATLEDFEWIINTIFKDCQHFVLCSIDNYYDRTKKHYDDEIAKRNASLKEDTVKQGNAWVNKGKEGTHGKFKTKKAADAQRKAMFANGYKESLKESADDTKALIDFLKSLKLDDEVEEKVIGDWTVNAWTTEPRLNFSRGFYIVQIDNDKLNKHFSISDCISQKDFEYERDRVIKNKLGKSLKESADDDVLYIATSARGNDVKVFSSLDARYKHSEDNTGWQYWEVPKKEFKSLAKQMNRNFAFNRLHQEGKTKVSESLKESIDTDFDDKKVRDEVVGWWDAVEKWNDEHNKPYDIDNGDKSDVEAMHAAMFDMLVALRDEQKDSDEAKALVKDGKRVYNKYSVSRFESLDTEKVEEGVGATVASMVAGKAIETLGDMANQMIDDNSFKGESVEEEKKQTPKEKYLAKRAKLKEESDCSEPKEKPEFLHKGDWVWDDVACDWYDNESGDYHLELVHNSELPLGDSDEDLKYVEDMEGFEDFKEELEESLENVPIITNIFANYNID